MGKAYKGLIIYHSIMESHKPNPKQFLINPAQVNHPHLKGVGMSREGYGQQID